MNALLFVCLVLLFVCGILHNSGIDGYVDLSSWRDIRHWPGFKSLPLHKKIKIALKI